jgi:hypothetical protein
VKLKITGKGCCVDDYDFYLNDVHLDAVDEVRLSFKSDAWPMASIKFTVDEVEIDGDVVGAMKVMSEEPKHKGGKKHGK